MKAKTLSAAAGFVLLVASFVAIAQPVAGGGGISRVQVEGGGLEGSGTGSNKLRLRSDCGDGQLLKSTSGAWSCTTTIAVTPGGFTLDTDGFAALFSTHAAASTDGQNIWIGGGGQNAARTINATQGSSNTSLGWSALNANTTGNYNSAFGHMSMPVCTTCIDNTGVGQASLLSLTSGIDNTAVGVQALELVTNGSFNTAVGLNALQFTTGSNNTAIGMEAGQLNDTGSFNVFVGIETGETATASNNTLVGARAAQVLTTGDLNTILGKGAGAGLTTGRANTILGPAGTLTSSLSNNVIISDGDANQRIVIDNTGTWQSTLTLNGSLTWLASATGYGSLTMENTLTMDTDINLVLKGHVKSQGGAVTLTNATCNATRCDDIAGTITTSATSFTIAFADSYTGADDATCIVQLMGGTTVPTFTVSATAITATVAVNGGKYKYLCVGH